VENFVLSDSGQRASHEVVQSGTGGHDQRSR
jgi:hypothetical protein